MIQFNLLPNVKLEYVKAKRNKRLTILAAGATAATALAILIILFAVVNIFQKKYSSDLSKDIGTQTSQLKSIPDIDKVLTIQNQLSSLPALHDQKPVVTRLFGYLKQLTPAKVSIASMEVDFDKHTVSITGSADAISTVNKFADTLKFTTYKTGDNKTGSAFNSVVLSNFGRDDKGASYQLVFSFDPTIFTSSSDVTLVVPSGKITTRSETEKPEDLFQPLSNKNGTNP